MRVERVLRSEMSPDAIDGTVVVADVPDRDGRPAFERGTRLAAGDCARLLGLAWTELHVIRLEEGDLGEHAAGTRLARAASGHGTAPGDATGGHWPIVATSRGIVAIDEDALLGVNRIAGLAVYTLPQGQVVDAGEVVARAKILPFAVGGKALRDAESLAAGGIVAVQPFVARRVAAVVQESLGSSALDRFRRSLAEKVAWFGGTLGEVQPVAPEAEAIAGALTAARASGAELVVLAGARAMDPLDPAFDGVAGAGGTVERVGVPAHPGSLLWLARVARVLVVGMPSCGLFSRATVFDLVLPRFMAGLPMDDDWLAGLGHGGLLTRDMAWRFPPYRPRHDRGAVD